MYYIKMFQDKEAPGLSWKDRNSDMPFGKKVLFRSSPHITYKHKFRQINKLKVFKKSQTIEHL